jgi:hypothetical protein
MLMGPDLHNGRVLQRVGSVLVGMVLLSASALLAGCSDDDKSPEADPASSSAPTESSSSASSSSAVATDSSLPVPEGVELSPEGSQLSLGDMATVAYEVRQGVVGVLDIKVTRLEKTTFKESFVGWDLDAGQKKANPYFVRATITNRGETDLGGRRPPLYIVDGNNTLVEPTTFESTFTPCEPGSFPKKFPNGKSAKVCLVFLSPNKGELTAVSFRPTQDFDPITWTGELQAPKPPKPPKGKGGKGDGDGQTESGGSAG